MQSSEFDIFASKAAASLDGPRPGDAEWAARVNLWREQEWHGWFRWRLCACGFDWSKPIWILLLVAGFGALILYGALSRNWFVTAGGVVFWFTLVNLAFFTYFGLSLPGPPPPVPGPFPPGLLVRATMTLYPAGYNRRKRARVCLNVVANAGEPYRIELALESFPPDLLALLKQQETWRIQRGDAPPTEAIVETLPVSREQIDSGQAPIRVIAWRWKEPMQNEKH